MMSQTDFTVLVVYDDDDDDEVKCLLHRYYYDIFNIQLCVLTYMNCDCIFRVKLAIFKSIGQVALMYPRAIYIQSNEIHNVVALIKFLLVLRCQLYMFRTVTVHPQELPVDTVCADYGTW